jgi:hypothetical protein
MKDIRQEQAYQDQSNLDRQRESNRMTQQTMKNDIDREKIQAQKEIADTQLQIARENKNKFDSKNTKKKDK